MQDHPYECLSCGAIGRIPLVEGDSACPNCGEHLWTVRAQLPNANSDSLRPAASLPILRGRPPLRPRSNWFARFCVLLLRPLVILWLIPRQHVLENRVNAKLDQIADCGDRGALEQVLGKPRYAVSGDVCDAADAPDLIECYESEGCCIDLWFTDDRIVDITGFVKPSDCELLLSGVK